MFNKKNKGISLYLTLVVLSVLTVILFSLVGIVVSQIRVIWTISHSTIAFFAADTGIEHGLYQIRKQNNYTDIPETVLGNASYSVTITTTTDETTISSLGNFRDIRRALEVVY